MKRIQILLFDPVYYSEISASLRKDHFEVLRIPHGLDIPAGIGFSHYVAPLLLKNGLWKELLELVGQLLFADPEIWIKNKQALKETGIEVDLEFFVRFAPDVIPEWFDDVVSLPASIKVDRS